MKPQNAEFTRVNEHFWGKRNEVDGVYRQTLSNLGLPGTVKDYWTSQIEPLADAPGLANLIPLSLR